MYYVNKLIKAEAESLLESFFLDHPMIIVYIYIINANTNTYEEPIPNNLLQSTIIKRHFLTTFSLTSTALSSLVRHI